MTKIENAKALLARVEASPSEIAAARAALQEVLGSTSTTDIKGHCYLQLANAALIVKQDLKGALPLYQQAIELLAPASEPWLEANLGYGTAIQHQLPVSPASIRSATEHYVAIIETGSASPVAAQARLNLGRIYELQDYANDALQLDLARQEYAAIIEQWPNAKIAHEAALRLGSTYLQAAYYPGEEKRTDWEWRIENIITGIDFLSQWSQTHSTHSLKPAIWEYIGNAYLLLPERDEWRQLALEAYLKATGDDDLIESGQPAPRKNNIDRVNPGYLYLRIASLAHQQGKRDIAFEYYARLISETPSYGHGPESALQLTANLGFTRGEIIERLTQQYQYLNYTEAEIDSLLASVRFLDRPVGIEVPSP